ncbi:hypothetical protein H5410_004959 [Solanum commersonii]|uniref:Uncharacterized protein n=1 Tax=Solanum commersonii TaxID=4109 RepID=A0A9J6A5B1_SOLCO|nr:hypothetical protein H5410_004959 [Solanum commersonii]
MVKKLKNTLRGSSSALLCIAELKLACRKGIPLNSGVRVGSTLRRRFVCVQIEAREQVRDRGPGHQNSDNMFNTQRSGKAVASSSRKRVRTGTTIPPAPIVPRG